ncbi:hypothetical protein EDD11_009641 [Mortierella claussenii]|nr:hypothetical protein EDD11_009641 [Mortierella claussenii]
MKTSLSACAFLALVMIAPTMFMTPLNVKAKSSTISVLSNNVYFLTEIINWGQRTRARLIATSDYIQGHDVVVIQECFASAPCNILREGLKEHYPYQTSTLGHKISEWDSTWGSFSSFNLQNGGVVVMSKWPIKEQHQFVFAGGCGFDQLSNKGFVYAVLNREGTNLHVFATHMQSDDIKGLAAHYRGIDLDEWRKFTDARNIPEDELVIMAGDFNIHKMAPEFEQSLLMRLDVRQPDVYDGHESTWDPIENSIAHRNYPQRENGDYIDYVFVDKKHDRNVKSVVQTVLKVHSPSYSLGSEVYDDFSDHFPVKAVIELSSPELVVPAESTVTVTTERNGKYCTKGNSQHE